MYKHTFDQLDNNANKRAKTRVSKGLDFQNAAQTLEKLANYAFGDELADQFLNLMVSQNNCTNPNEQQKTPVPNTPNNAIYKAIAADNMSKLMSLLNSNVHLSFFANRVSSHHRHRIWHDKDTERKVIEFFNTTPADTMRELIKDSQHKYFNLLVRAISPHKRYQLAITKCFKPLIMYLPFNQLSPMINDFIDRGLYLDHDALKQLIWDLRARRIQEEDNKAQQIIVLETKLLNTGMDHHKSAKHWYVLDDLKEFKNSLTQKITQDDSDYEDIDIDESNNFLSHSKN